jgi:stage VI sporulation protein D
VQEEEDEDSFASASAFSFPQQSVQQQQPIEPNQPVQGAASPNQSPFNQQPAFAPGEARQLQDNEAERKELRVAFGRKRPEEAESEREAVGFRTLLSSSRREQETRDAAEAAQVPAREGSRVTTGDEIEWKTLFLGKLSDEQAFRKVRMCIVQREETLDDIAARYGKNSRELSLYNRLQDQSLIEGQVLYIP